MSDQTTKRLRDALAACEAVETFLAGCSLSVYREEYGLRLQIERLLEIIGEALNQASLTDDDDSRSDTADSVQSSECEIASFMATVKLMIS